MDVYTPRLTKEQISYLASLRVKTTARKWFQHYLKCLGDGLTVHAQKKFQFSYQNMYPIAVLRAGLGLLPLRWPLTDNGVGFIDVKRDHETLQPTLGMYKCRRDLHGLTVLVYETMLATGGSLSAAISAVKHESRMPPQRIIAITLLVAPEGIRRMKTDHPDVDIVTACVDEGLDEHGYIVPGLGDAGDRLYGPID